MGKKEPFAERLAAYDDGAKATRQLGRRQARLLAGALLTAGAACAAGGQGQAAVIYHDEIPDALVKFNYIKFVSFTGAGRGTKFSIRYNTSPKSIYISHWTNYASAARQAAQRAANFALNDTIGPGANWTHTSILLCKYGGTDSNFKGKDGYIGVRFNDSTRAGIVYGWIRFEGEASGVVGYVKAWAYDDSGASIRAGEGQ